MKKNILMSVVFLFPFFLFGQNHKFIEIDYSEIEQRVKNGEYYQSIVDKWNSPTDSISVEELGLLYYGFRFQPGYTGSANSEMQELTRFIQEEEWEKAYNQSQEVLQRNPVSLEGLYYAFVSGKQINVDENTVNAIAAKWWMLLDLIGASGDGTKEHPFYVIQVSDEYDFMYNYLEVDVFKGQSLAYGDNNTYFDIMSIEPTKIYPRDEIYFDITPSLVYTQKLLKGK